MIFTRVVFERQLFHLEKRYFFACAVKSGMPLLGTLAADGGNGAAASDHMSLPGPPC